MKSTIECTHSPITEQCITLVTAEKKYTNSKEKLLAIKEKYKNGISKEMIENWLEIK